MFTRFTFDDVLKGGLGQRELQAAKSWIECGQPFDEPGKDLICVDDAPASLDCRAFLEPETTPPPPSPKVALQKQRSCPPESKKRPTSAAPSGGIKSPPAKKRGLGPDIDPEIVRLPNRWRLGTTPGHANNTKKAVISPEGMVCYHPDDIEHLKIADSVTYNKATRSQSGGRSDTEVVFLERKYPVTSNRLIKNVLLAAMPEIEGVKNTVIDVEDPYGGTHKLLIQLHQKREKVQGYYAMHGEVSRLGKVLGAQNDDLLIFTADQKRTIRVYLHQDDCIESQGKASIGWVRRVARNGLEEVPALGALPGETALFLQRLRAATFKLQSSLILKEMNKAETKLRRKSLSH